MGKQNNLEVAEFRAQLDEQKSRIQKNIADLKSGDPFADPDHVTDNAAIDTDVREQIGHETIEAEIVALSRRLGLINMAVGKIEKGTYGVCERCGKPILVERLALIPETRYDIDCEKLMVV